MSKWPAAQLQAATVENELWRSWDDESPRTITAAQTVPPLVAGLAIPALEPATGEALAEATRAVGDLREHAARTTGVLGHLSAVLIRADAVASSQIEHLTTSSEALAVALADLRDDDPDRSPYPVATELVAANVTVALSAQRGTEDLTEDWFHRRHRSLLAAVPELERRHLGAWRDCAVWIGQTRQSADFEGPPWDQVPVLMDDLVRFAARSDVHPVVHAAIAHAQFETIHPYVDGNGRIGRLLIHRLLDARPATATAPVPVAHGLLHNPTGYVDGLSAYRSGDLDNWIAVFATAVTNGAHAAVRLVNRIDGIAGDYRQRVRTREGSAVSQILDGLLHTPAITAGEIQAAHKLTPGRASQILHQLADAGVVRLSDHRAGRARVWVAHEVIDAIDTINATIPRRLLDTSNPSGGGEIGSGDE